MTQSAFSTGRETVAGRVRAWTAMAAMLIAVCSATAATFGQCSYSVQEIVPPSCPFGGPPAAIVTGLNNHGEVVGHHAICQPCEPICEARVPFFWSEATGYVPLPLAEGADSARPYDINDHGQIVGEHRFLGIGWRGFMYDMKTDTYHQLEPKLGVGMAVVSAINNSGIAAGTRSITKAGNTPHNAVIWDTNTGKVQDLGVMQGPNSAARAINEAGAVAGWDGNSITNNIAAFWDSNQEFLLGPIPGAITSDAGGINDHGWITGAGWTSGSQVVGFVWQNDVFEVIGPPDGYQSAGARTLNNHNQVIVLGTISAGVQRPLLWQNGQMIDLNDFTPGKPLLTQPSDINDSGQILVRASTQGALLTPIDVPLGDLNFDCQVDVDDLLILLEAWGLVRTAAGTGANADLNGDGVVNILDLLILLENFTGASGGYEQSGAPLSGQSRD